MNKAQKMCKIFIGTVGFLSSEEGEINGFEAGEDYEKSRNGPV